MFAQTIAILFDRPVALDPIAEALASREPRRIEAEPEEGIFWMQGAGSLVVRASSGTNAAVSVTPFDRQWPDGMGDPKTDPELFGSWSLKYFGWGTFPLGLARAAAFCPERDRGTALREGHKAFVRCQLSYIFGADDQALVFPEDRDLAGELRELASIGSRLLDLPGALAWFHPVGEVLRPLDEVRDDLIAQTAGEQRTSLWIGRRVYPAGRLAVVETVGMGALGAKVPGERRDVQAVFSPEAVDIERVFDLVARLSSVEEDDAAAEGKSLVGPGGQWESSVVESDNPPPREILRWTLGGAEAFEAPAELSEEEASRWVSHLEAHFGTCGSVFHELVSDAVHLDVLRFPPVPGRDFHVLVTQGMSARPMTVPEGAEEFQFAELLLALPPDWILDGPGSDEDRWYWPTRILKFIARLPHLYETWIGHGHTIPNGDPAEPYADNTKLDGAIVGAPTLLPEAAQRCEVAPGKTVCVYALYPVYGDEMNFKLENGADALLEKLAERGVTERVDPARRSVLKKRFWIV